MSTSASASLKAYLKRYESNTEDKKKKKKIKKGKTDITGVVVVDEDPIWQKPVKLDEEDDSPDEKPQVEEDVDVKRMKRLEQLRAKRPYHGISEDGSGWVPISDVPNPSISGDLNVDISPPRRQRSQYDSPSSLPESYPLRPCEEATDMSPPRQHRRHYGSRSRSRQPHIHNDSSPRQHRRHSDFPSPDPERKPSESGQDVDLSPPQQHCRRCDSHSPMHEQMPSDSGRVPTDLSPPRHFRRRYESLSPETEMKPSNSTYQNIDLSSPCHKKEMNFAFNDISPHRRMRHTSATVDDSRGSAGMDLSPPRKGKTDLSPPRKSRELPKTGLVTRKYMKEEIARTNEDDWLWFKEMNPLISGQGAEPVYRDKGRRISKEEYLKLQNKEQKPKKLEWGKGLAQKREAEQSLLDLEHEKDKPFARSREDPELDKLLRERERWGDPMAHLVKRRQPEPILPDLGEGEKMKESGFIIPQEIPSHSWILRGLDAAPNRYGIKPGRHWDGVDRSNGYEKELFNRMNEKRATEREAYLWSVSDM